MNTLDIRAIEAGIRAAYRKLDVAAKAKYANQANWEGRQGAAVDLADLRAALPADWPKEGVDRALALLADHADVAMWPKTDQKHAKERDAAAAVPMGGTHLHAIQIDRQAPEPDRVVERLKMRDREHAESHVAALGDDTVKAVAERMGVDPGQDPAVVRKQLVDKSVSNLKAWQADAQQGQEDGSLLYKADTEPEWVATWTDEDRQKAADAAGRLQERAKTDPSWAFVKDRADRWAQPAPAADTKERATGDQVLQADAELDDSDGSDRAQEIRRAANHVRWQQRKAEADERTLRQERELEPGDDSDRAWELREQSNRIMRERMPAPDDSLLRARLAGVEDTDTDVAEF